MSKTMQSFADSTRSILQSARDAGAEAATFRAPAARDLLAAMRSHEAAALTAGIRSGAVDPDKLVIRELSREVSTHYKWCLYSDGQLSVWLNEYKPGTHQGYARTVHNHRYSFASHVVWGSLEQRQFSIKHAAGRISSIDVKDISVVKSGEDYCLGSDDVHEVTRWEPGTASLVLKGPAVRAASEVFDFSQFSVHSVSSISALRPLATSPQWPALS